MKTHGRLAALGALGVSAGSLLLWFGLIFITRRSSTGGLDSEHSVISWISTGVIFLALIAAHVVFAKQLWKTGDRQTSERADEQPS